MNNTIKKTIPHNLNNLASSADTLASSMKSGGYTNCVLFGRDSSLNCWGTGKFGQNDVPSAARQKVSDFSVGLVHSCAVNDDWARLRSQEKGRSRESESEKGQGIKDRDSDGKRGKQAHYKLRGSGSNKSENRNRVMVDENETGNHVDADSDSVLQSKDSYARVINPQVVDAYASPAKSNSASDSPPNQYPISSASRSPNSHPMTPSPHQHIPLPKPNITTRISNRSTPPEPQPHPLYQFPQAFCWGSNQYGQTDISPAAQPQDDPYQFQDQYTRVMAGGSHSCGITVQGHMQCWGNNKKGQSKVDSQFKNVRVSDLKLGHMHTCFNYVDNNVNEKNGEGSGRIIGKRNNGYIGANQDAECIRGKGGIEFFNRKSKCSLTQTDQQTQIDPDHQSSIPDSKDLSLEKTTRKRKHPNHPSHRTKTLYCIGQNEHGQSDVPDSYQHSVHQISTGMVHTCIITLNNFGLTCWGYNSTNLNSPQRYTRNVRMVKSGQEIICAANFSDGGKNDVSGSNINDINKINDINNDAKDKQKDDNIKVYSKDDHNSSVNCYWQNGHKEILNYNESDFKLENSKSLYGLSTGLRHYCVVQIKKGQNKFYFDESINIDCQILSGVLWKKIQGVFKK